jgi:hypothetical protein
MIRGERPMKSGSRYATDRDTAFTGQRDDPFDQLTASLAASRTDIEAVFDNDPVRAIDLNELGDLAEIALPRVRPSLGAAQTPVDKQLRAVEDREAEPFRDGVDGKDAFHS